MYYYVFSNSDNRCYSVSDYPPQVSDVETVFQSADYVTNFHDYILQNGAMVYSPKETTE